MEDSKLKCFEAVAKGELPIPADIKEAGKVFLEWSLQRFRENNNQILIIGEFSMEFRGSPYDPHPTINLNSFKQDVPINIKEAANIISEWMRSNTDIKVLSLGCETFTINLSNPALFPPSQCKI
jgi:hypothetical protein